VIDAFASEGHYAAHLQPIWEELQGRGTFWACGTALDRLDLARLDPRPCRRPTADDRRVVVASYRDLWMLQGTGHVLVEHGAGQTYSNRSASYSGGHGREAVGLFVCPSECVADRNRRRYPGALAAAVGVPALDAWHRGDRPLGDGSTVAVSFHWNATVAPEARSAYPHFRSALMALAGQYRVIGHGHPRVFEQLRPIYERCGIEPVADFSKVLDRAAVYVCDNSSTIFEFASTGRPVVLLNAPWYRRDVEHGLRFWEMADVGVQVNEPEDLAAGIAWALEDEPRIAERRAAIVQQVYVATDGKAARRAAEVIEALERS